MQLKIISSFDNIISLYNNIHVFNNIFRSNNEPHISIPMANGNDSTTLNATDSEHYLNLIKPLNNITREAGESVRLKCEFTGNPLPKVQWYKHEAPIETEKGRVLIKYSGVRDQPDRVRARLIINRLDTHDIGFYKCEASNGYKTVHSTGVLIVKTGMCHILQ